MIHVVNKRAERDSPYKPEPCDLVIAADRSNPVLGNPFVMRAKTREERERVIKAFAEKHADDFACNGPIYRESVRIAGLMLGGQHVALECLCKPLPCHADVIAQGIAELFGDMRSMARLADDIYPAGSLPDRAARFAAESHARVLQRRKYTLEPYIHHPLEVARIVSGVTDDEEMIAAALLHDVVEDTGVALSEIKARFGQGIATLVENLTDVSVPEDGNRQARKAIDRAHTAQASPRAKTIKLADLISNTSSIMAHDPEFASVYMVEKELLLGVLRQGDPLPALNALNIKALDTFNTKEIQ